MKSNPQHQHPAKDVPAHPKDVPEPLPYGGFLPVTAPKNESNGSGTPPLPRGGFMLS